LEPAFKLKDLPKEVGGELQLDYEATFATCQHWATREVVDI